MIKLKRLSLIPLVALSLIGCDKPTEEKPVDPPVVTYTAESVMQDIVKAVFGKETATVGTDYFTDGSTGFYTGVNFGTTYATEYYLETAVQQVEAYIPTYCEVSSARAAGTWEEGDSGYFATYVTTDKTVAVDIGSYLSTNNGSTYLIAQINTSPVTAE